MRFDLPAAGVSKARYNTLNFQRSLVDAANGVRDFGRKTTSGVPFQYSRTRSWQAVQVKNVGGIALKTGDPAWVVSTLVKPVDNTLTPDPVTTLLEVDNSGGVVPKNQQFVIAKSAIAVGETGWAVIHGAAMVQVYEGDNLAWCQQVTFDSTRGSLSVDPKGQADILWVENRTASTSKHAWIHLGAPTHRTVLGIAAKDIQPQFTVTTQAVNCVDLDTASLDPSGHLIDCYLDWLHGDVQVSQDKQVICQYFPVEDKWRIVGAECEDSTAALGSSGLSSSGGTQALSATWAPPTGMVNTFSQGGIEAGTTPNALRVTRPGTYRAGGHFSLNVGSTNSDVAIRVGNSGAEGWHQVNYHEKTADNGLAGSSERFLDITTVPTEVAFEINGNNTITWETCALILEAV